MKTSNSFFTMVQHKFLQAGVLLISTDALGPHTAASFFSVEKRGPGKKLNTTLWVSMVQE